ncbi:hypothetical protein CY34DRAFT_786970, partial [Suillus luteus UH-Slu-Lm8-n1]
REDLPPVLYELVTCKPPCRAILNPYWYVSSLSFIHSTNDAPRRAICPFYLTRNAFPPHHKDISNTNLPADLLPKYMTISSCSTTPPLWRRYLSSPP